MFPFTLFKEALNSEIYVDKSLLIEKVSAKINTGNKYICITRPRRFGKTINANMLGTYFTKVCDSHQDFIISIIKKIRSDISSAYLLSENMEHDSISEMLRDTVFKIWR